MAKYGMAVDLRRCAGCGGCVVACQMQNNQSPGVSWNKLEVYEWGIEAGDCGRSYLPHACMQCDDAPCVAACPTGASVKREDGIVVVEYDSCIACGFCMSACPYEARVLNGREQEYFFGAYAPAPYESYGVQRNYVVEKCIFCEGRLEEGLKPACVVNCPGKARYFGDLDDPESEISAFIASHDPVRIDETSFYYLPIAGTPEEVLPFAHGSLEPTQAEPAVSPVAIGVGAGVVAAVAAGAVLARGKARKAAESDSDGVSASSEEKEA